MIKMSPGLVLEGDSPRLIGEWQEVPPLWDAVRHKVDKTGEKGQFILTGSATPNHKGIMHSVTGRIALRSFARNESTTATNTSLAKDIKNSDDTDIDKGTPNALTAFMLFPSRH